MSETLRELLELRALSRKEAPRADAVMVSPDTLDALLDIAEAAQQLREEMRSVTELHAGPFDYGTAWKRNKEAQARLDAAIARLDGTGER